MTHKEIKALLAIAGVEFPKYYIDNAVMFYGAEHAVEKIIENWNKLPYRNAVMKHENTYDYK